jgi:uncharacterized repeat protein (TIGR02543 family)
MKRASFLIFVGALFVFVSTSVVWAGWTAYNDLDPRVPSGSTDNAPNVTEHDYGVTEGALKDFDTGADLSVTITGSYNSWDPVPNGDNANAGTDAGDIFGPPGARIADVRGISELDQASWYNTVVFNHLDPAKEYNITLTANRASESYANQRFTRVTIEGAETYTNESSAGVVVNSASSVSFSVGYNTVNGYVAKWTGVTSGPDSSFSVKSEWDDSQAGTKGYAMSVFCLEEVSTAAQCTLTVNTVGGGSVALDPPGGIYDEDTIVELAADADPGWVFSGWSGDLGGSANPETITMDANKTVTATFVLAPVNWMAYNDLDPRTPSGPTNNAPNVTEHDYAVVGGVLKNVATGADLSVTMTGSYNGWDPVPNGDNANAGTDAGDLFGPTGARIADLRGISELDSAHWYNTVTFENLDPTKEYHIILTANRDNAGYAGERFTRVTIEGAETYTNESSAGVVVNSASSVSFSVGYNTVNGYVAKWTGVTSGPDGSFSVKSEWDDSQAGTKGYAMSAFCLVEVGDAPPPQYTLTVNVVGGGSVTLDPPGGTYVEDTVVELTADADPGWVFSGWSGDLGGSANPETITMDANKTVTATFVLAPVNWMAYNDLDPRTLSGPTDNAPNVTEHDYTVVAGVLKNVATGADLSVTITGSYNNRDPRDNGDNANAGTDAGDIFGPPDDRIVDLRATSEMDSAHWYNTVTFDDLDPAKEYHITLTANRDNVSYAGERFTKVNIEGAETYTNESSAGVIEISASSVSFGVGYNTVNGYVAKWTGVTSGPDGSFSVKSEWDDSQAGTKGYAMSGFCLVEVGAAPVWYDLTVNIVGGGSVTLDPPGGTYAGDTVVELTADADPGWVFSGWSGDLGGSANPETITMDANKTVTATFGLAPVNWMAYNDLDPRTLSGPTDNAPNVTEHDYTVVGGVLKNVATGADLSVTITGSYNNRDPQQNGDNANAGTDAGDIFGPPDDRIVDLRATSEMDSAHWYNTVTFENLDPTKEYSITLSANRDKVDYAGARYTKVTIEGAEAYTNASSPGVVVNSETSVSFGVGYNTVNGYVAKWTGVTSGSDGSFSVKSEWDSTQGSGDQNTKGYAMSGFYLVEVGDAPVPVELSSFTATGGQGFIALEWITASEVNCYRWEVYRGDGKDGEYVQIGERPGHGSTETAHAYRWVDRQVRSEQMYFYRLKQIDFDGTSWWSPVAAAAANLAVPKAYALNQNYPNPFNANTEIRYQISGDDHVSLKVFNSQGQEVLTLIDGVQKAGWYGIIWDGRDNVGKDVSSGTYFCRLRAGDFEKTIKMTLIR